MAGKSSLVVFVVTGIVTGMGFDPFVADHGYVPSPPNMMTHRALD